MQTLMRKLMRLETSVCVSGGAAQSRSRILTGKADDQSSRGI